MSKKQKKRTKRYQGEDAKQTTAASSAPVVHRYEAVERSRFSEWLQPRKRALKLGGAIVGGGAAVVWLLVELFTLVF